MNAIGGNNIFNFPPPPQHKNHKGDKSKNYDFHGDYGHSIEECQDLKSELERARKDDQINDFL